MPPARIAGLVLAVLTGTACRDLPRVPTADGGAEVGRDTGGDVRSADGAGGQGGSIQPGPGDARTTTPDARELVPDAPADLPVDRVVDMTVDMVPPPPAEALWDEATWDLSLWGP